MLNWEVDSVPGVDKARHLIYFTSSEDSPLERQVYSIAFDGTGKRKVTTAAGTHTVSLSPTGDYYMDDFSSLTAPPASTIRNTHGPEQRSEQRVFREPDAAGAEYEILPTEIVKVKTADGAELYARMIKPAGFQPGV